MLRERWAASAVPLSFTADLSLGKQFQIREQMNFEFRVEAKNAFNHPVFGTPDTTVGDDTFGKISYTAFGPREVQLGVQVQLLTRKSECARSAGLLHSACSRWRERVLSCHPERSGNFARRSFHAVEGPL